MGKGNSTNGTRSVNSSNAASTRKSLAESKMNRALETGNRDGYYEAMAERQYWDRVENLNAIKEGRFGDGFTKETLKPYEDEVKEAKKKWDEAKKRK